MNIKPNNKTNRASPESQPRHAKKRDQHQPVFVQENILDGVAVSLEGVFAELGDLVGVEVQLTEVVQRAEGVGRDVVQPVVAHLKPFQVTCRSEGLAFFLFFLLGISDSGFGNFGADFENSRIS